ncbi:hypothetical protein Tco_0797682 [Tanacetum coccineum]
MFKKIARTYKTDREEKDKNVQKNYLFPNTIVFSSVIIMAQDKQAADVHQDELCPPNKRYDIMDANKKHDLRCSINHSRMIDIMKKIFNSGRNKNKVGMRIPTWMIKEEMKLTEHYKMYAEVFGLDVPMTQSQSTESTQGTHRTTSAPRSPNPATEPAELEPRSDKESPEVEIVQEKEEETTKVTDVEPNIVIPVNVDDEEDEITDEVFELRRRAKGKNVEESRISPIPSPTRSPRNISTLVSSDTKKLQELTVTHPTPSSGSFAPNLTKTNRLLSLIKAKPNRFKRYKTFFHELQGRYGYLFAHLKKRFMPQTSGDQLADNLHDVMMETLPSLVKEKVIEQVKKEVPAQVRDQVPVYLAKGLILERKTTKEETERLISKAIVLLLLLQQQDIAIWLALQMKFEKTQVIKTNDEFDFWDWLLCSDDDEIPTKQVSQDIMKEISLIIDEAKLKKMADEMLRQRCTLGDEHQYHIDQMKNFLQQEWTLFRGRERKFFVLSRILAKVHTICPRLSNEYLHLDILCDCHKVNVEALFIVPITDLCRVSLRASPASPLVSTLNESLRVP